MKRGLLVVLFWMIAAALVIAARGAAVATIAAVIGTAYAYSRFAAPDTGVSHALGVGSAWLTLSMATEIAVTTWTGQGWFSLLGSPDRPLLRNLYLFVWIFAPALFAHREVLS